MRFSTIVVILSLSFLSSCTQKETIVDVVPTEKTPFFVDTYSLDSASVQKEIEKTGRVTARSSLTLSAK